MSKSLVLRVCRENGLSRDGFVWPLSGPVKAPDWKATKNCGNGLHGWLYGQGDHSCADHWQDPKAQWLVVEVESDSIIELGGKVKFPEGIVRFAGDAKSATDYLWEHEPRSREVDVIGACRADKRNEARVSVGALGTATAGENGCICILWYDRANDVYRKRCAEVDGVKIKADTAYRLNEAGAFVEALK